MKATIVITDWGFPSLEPEKKVFEGKNIDVKDYQCKSEEDVAKVVPDADVVMAQWAPVRKKAIHAMTRCRGIVRYGIGLDNIDLEAAREKGITVKNVPDYCIDEVADHTMALMLSLQRQVPAVVRRIHEGTWSITPPLALPPLRECTLGLIGFGRIGRTVSNRAKAFGLNVAVFDPVVSQAELSQAGVKAVEFGRLIRDSDIVSLHCPLTEKTKHLINGSTLAMMKPTALLVNTSRGGLVDLEAVVTALRNGTIAGAAVDVFEKEPLPPDHPFLSIPNAVATSHIAWYSSVSIRQLQHRAALQALALLEESKHHG